MLSPPPKFTFPYNQTVCMEDFLVKYYAASAAANDHFQKCYQSHKF